MADSRRIKYYRVLRRVRKKVLLWGKHGGTLLFKKSMPFLFLATISSLLYLICIKLGSMDFFQSLLSKMGCSLGSRVLLGRGLGCEGWLLLVLILSCVDCTTFNMMGASGSSYCSLPCHFPPLLRWSNAKRPPYTNQIRFRVSIMLMDPFLTLF